MASEGIALGTKSKIPKPRTYAKTGLNMKLAIFPKRKSFFIREATIPSKTSTAIRVIIHFIWETLSKVAMSTILKQNNDYIS